MRVVLVGAELEENIGLRYMASSLEANGHVADIVPFNVGRDAAGAVRQTLALGPGRRRPVDGLHEPRPGVLPPRRATCATRASRGHLIAGGHFAALNAERLLADWPAFDSIALGEGEDIMIDLAADLDHPERVAGPLPTGHGTTPSCARQSRGNPDRPRRPALPQAHDVPPLLRQADRQRPQQPGLLARLRLLQHQRLVQVGRRQEVPHPQRGQHRRARWRSCTSSTASASSTSRTTTSSCLTPRQAVRRFEALRDGLREAGVGRIAIAVKARPDSISREAIRVLDDLGLFRVFLGVENASEHGLAALNRHCTVDDVLDALRILNDFDVHIAYNLLMFELDTTMDDVAHQPAVHGPAHREPGQLLPGRGVRGHRAGSEAARRRPPAGRLLRLRLPDARSARRKRSTRSPTTRSSTATSATTACTTSTCRSTSSTSSCAASTRSW